MQSFRVPRIKSKIFSRILSLSVVVGGGGVSPVFLVKNSFFFFLARKKKMVRHESHVKLRLTNSTLCSLVVVVFALKRISSY